MPLRLISIAVCLLVCGCASTQLNYNTADLASSLNSLTKRQIFYNLAQTLTDPEFVPSQATISIGTAQTLNAVTPSVSIPIGLPTVTIARDGTGRFAGSQFSTQVTSPTPTLGVQMTDSWTQSWTMVPLNSAPQLRRLLCEYPLQAFNVAPNSGNVVFKIDGCPNNNTRESQSRVVHVDPTFTQGPSCIICIDDLNAKQLRPHINPNLKYHFIRTQKTGDMVSLGSHGSTSFYVCGNAEGDCPRAERQEPFDGRKAFSAFILFVYEAATVPSSTGGGRQTGGSFTYAIR